MTFTPADLSERYAVTVHTVLGWIHDGSLRAINVGRKPGAKKPRWRITLEAIEQFESLRASAPTPRKSRRKVGKPIAMEFYQG